MNYADLIAQAARRGREFIAEDRERERSRERKRRSKVMEQKT